MSENLKGTFWVTVEAVLDHSYSFAPLELPKGLDARKRSDFELLNV